MARTTYPYDKSGVDLAVLAGEVMESGITNVDTEFVGGSDDLADSPAENLGLTFLNALSNADETILDGLVTDHVGTPMQEADNANKVLSRSLATPPVDPALRDAYIIAASATGAWAGMETKIAIWAKTMWEFYMPTHGVTAFVTDEGVTVEYDITDSWVAVAAKRRINATTDPTVDDDKDLGFAVSSVWVNVTTDKAYVCVNSSAGAAVWKETTGAAGAAHALGGADHTPATLAELNAKVSNATLIDTADSRLSDARTPTAHGLGGSEHSAGTLAELNAKVSNATLIDTADARLSDARTPTAHVHDVEMIEFDADVTTTSDTYELIPSLTKTPPAGTYKVHLSGSVEHTSNNDSIFAAIFKGGSIVAASEREFRRGAGQGDVAGTFHCIAVVTVDGSEAIEGMWKEQVGGTATMHQRQMLLEKVNAVTF